ALGGRRVVVAPEHRRLSVRPQPVTDPRRWCAREPARPREVAATWHGQGRATGGVQSPSTGNLASRPKAGQFTGTPRVPPIPPVPHRPQAETSRRRGAAT